MRQSYYAQIIADSINNNNRVTTFEITFPRFIAEQLLTHRMLSRNAGSLRATPTSKLLSYTSATPLKWSANQPGMVAGGDLVGVKRYRARLGWSIARLGARLGAWVMAGANLHKESVNRVLAPYLWQTFVVTSNEFGWNNFFKQRCAHDAQPEIYKISSLMRSEYLESTPRDSKHHIPYDSSSLWDPDESIKAMNRAGIGATDFARFVSVARIARVSLFNHGCNKIDYQKDIDLYYKLVHSEHYSPFDHVLTYDSSFVNGIYPGWKSLREELFPQFIQER